MTSKKSLLTALVSLLICVSAYSQRADALVLYRAGNYPEAIKICEQEISENPQNIDSYCVLCWSLVRNRQYAEAEQRSTEARKVNSSDVRLIEIQAEAKFYLGKNTAAMELFQLYLANVPANGIEMRTRVLWDFNGRERLARGKTCETGFERVSVRAVPEPCPEVGGVAGVAPAEGVAENAKAAVARGVGSDPLAGQNSRGEV